jgi:hypothetical protein
MLASIVDQLAKQAESVPSTLENMYDVRERDPFGSRSPTLLFDALVELILAFTAVYLYIDALDEFPSRGIDVLLKQVIQIHKRNLQPLHIVLTSQPHHVAIKGTLAALVSDDQGYQLNLEDAVADDIRAHIIGSIQESFKFQDRWGGGQISRPPSH